MFCGRLTELLALERALLQTKHSNPLHFLLDGERGIGKSSLLFYLECVASNKFESLQFGEFTFLTVSIELDKSYDCVRIIRGLGQGLRRAVSADDQILQHTKSLWDFLQRWEVMGVKYNAPEQSADEHELLEDLTHSIVETVAQTRQRFDGILFLVDEADKPSAEAGLGRILKVLTERLTKRGCNQVCFGLAGLKDLLGTLRKSHESSPRLFQVLTLEPLLPNERVEVVEKGLADVYEKCHVKVEITPEAQGRLSALSEGYPHFLQQQAYCAFEADKDNVIDDADVREGAWGEFGAFEQLGRKYFEDLYLDQISSDNYRAVLQTMSVRLDDWVSKAEIRSATQITASQLNNAIQALKQRKIIIPRKGQTGVYRLPSKSFAVWVRSFPSATESATAAEPTTP